MGGGGGARPLLLTALLALAAAQTEEVWIEQYDENTNRLFYYHSETRESRWEAPAGVKITPSDDPRAADAIKADAASGTSAPSRRGLSATDPSTIMMTLGSFAVPLALAFGGLLYLYLQASKEGLHDALRSLKEKRDRSARRKGTKAGSKFRHKFKLSQDGKGGRSANS